jgi:hypothetical protein
MSESTSAHRVLDVRVDARQPHEPTGRHRSRGRAGAATPALHARTRHTGPEPASRLILVGFAIALLLGWPFLTDSPVARSLAWAGLAVGGVFVGVGTVAAGVRLGLRWFDDHH